MAATALVNIGTLVTNDATLGNGTLGVIENAALIFEGEQITWVGPATEAPIADQRIDLAGRAVLPGFVDSHAHLMSEARLQ